VTPFRLNLILISYFVLQLIAQKSLNSYKSVLKVKKDHHYGAGDKA